MLIELVLCLLTINILIKSTSTQFYANQYYQNMPQQYYEQQPEDYDEPIESGRRRSRTKYGSSGGKLPTIIADDDEESDECKCSCNRCKEPDLPSCCREFCNSCQAATNPNSQQGSFVFVPYPYPLMFPSFIRNETSATTTTTPTITTEPKIQTLNFNENPPETTLPPPTKEEGVSSENFDKSRNRIQRKTSLEPINDFGLRSPQNIKPERRYMLTTMRKTKPAWQPKYGIVPIPDKLAEKLMSQLRQVRDFQPRKY